MTKYAASIYARRETQRGNEMQHKAESITASNEDEAAGKAYNKAIAMWPLRDGWSGHSAVVVEVK